MLFGKISVNYIKCPTFYYYNLDDIYKNILPFVMILKNVCNHDFKNTVIF